MANEPNLQGLLNQLPALIPGLIGLVERLAVVEQKVDQPPRLLERVEALEKSHAVTLEQALIGRVEALEAENADLRERLDVLESRLEPGRAEAEPEGEAEPKGRKHK